MMNDTEPNKKPNILIVDDEPDNLHLLAKILQSKDYRVRPASSGERALGTIQKELPHLILLDVLMPEMDGYEVCRALKAATQSKNIPVIFISALGQTSDKVKGFDCGGVDFITKPFQAEEVLARVKTHLTLRQLQQELHEQNVLILDQNEQLLKLNANKDRFFSIIAHDLKNPLVSFLSFASIMENIDRLDENKLKDLINHFRTSAENLFSLLENLLSWSRIQQDLLEYHSKNVSLELLIDKNIALVREMAQQKKIDIKKSVSEDRIIQADINMIDTVIRNLLTNALKFTNPGGTVEVSLKKESDSIELIISDTGTGIPVEKLPNLFIIESKYQQPGTSGEKGTGLGLILCKEFVEKNGGTIHAESEPGTGSRFICRFTVSG